MPIEIEAPRIYTRGTPREVIAEDFKSIRGMLPIRGGWGYSAEDAVVIDRYHPAVPKDLPFDGIGIEYLFVEKRLYEELIIFRKQGEAYSGIKWELERQELSGCGGVSYDILRFDVSATPDLDWNELKAKWEGPNGYGSPGFDVDAHQREQASRSIHYVAEYWFDISSFYGKENKESGGANDRQCRLTWRERFRALLHR